jgi:micrococcal nuclease
MLNNLHIFANIQHKSMKINSLAKDKQVFLSVNKTEIILTHLKVLNIVDGDGLIVKNILTNEEFEIRLLGIDAPEIKKCPKLLQDERETHISGALLMQLGYISFKYLLSKVPVGSNITLKQEIKNLKDKYNRTLAYAYLSDGTCINEMMIERGYAKPYNKFFCSELSKYQILHNQARKGKRGLFEKFKKF